MHKEVLSKEQIDLLAFVKQFQKEFYLVGGTAIALQIGHRRSIDFDFYILPSLRTLDFHHHFTHVGSFEKAKECLWNIFKTFHDRFFILKFSLM